MEQKNRIRETSAASAPVLSLRELYYHGIFDRKLFTVEDVLIDIHNRRINADIAARDGELDPAEYAEVLSETGAAAAYFEAGVAAAWFRDEGFEKDEEGRVTKIDGEDVAPLPVETLRESMGAFLVMMRKDGTKDPGIPLVRVYEAGVFRYGDFTVEEAAVDVHNRLTEAYLALDAAAERWERLSAETSADHSREQAKNEIASLKDRIGELKEARAWADSELVKVHFLMTDVRKDACGRFITHNGQPVIPIDEKKLREEYEEYLCVVMRQKELRNGRTADAASV